MSLIRSYVGGSGSLLLPQTQAGEGNMWCKKKAEFLVQIQWPSPRLSEISGPAEMVSVSSLPPAEAPIQVFSVQILSPAMLSSAIMILRAFRFWQVEYLSTFSSPHWFDVCTDDWSRYENVLLLPWQRYLGQFTKQFSIPQLFTSTRITVFNHILDEQRYSRGQLTFSQFWNTPRTTKDSCYDFFEGHFEGINSSLQELLKPYHDCRPMFFFDDLVRRVQVHFCWWLIDF